MNSFYSGLKSKNSNRQYILPLCLLLLCLSVPVASAPVDGALIALDSAADRVLPLIGSRLALFRPTSEYIHHSAQKSRTALLQSGPEALAWFSSREHYDELILVSLAPFDRFERLQISRVEAGVVVPLLDTLIPLGVPSEATSAIDQALCMLCTADNQGALSITDVHPLQVVTVDAKHVDSDTPILLTSGEHSVCFDEGQCMDVVIRAGEITTISVPPWEPHREPLVVRSALGVVNWYVDGTFVSQSHSLEVQEPHYPLSIGITKEHYTPHLLTLHRPPEQALTLSLQSALSGAERIVDQQQQDFYKGLRNTILLFGAYVATVVFGQSSPNPAFWELGQVTTGALAIVQAIATGAHLASYGQASGLL